MTGRPRSRANGEGSIYPHRNGYAAYVWVTTPAGERKRKYVYGKTRDDVHARWVTLHTDAKAGPVASKVPTLGAYLAYWLAEVVEPNLAPATYANYEMFTRLYIVPGLGAKRLDRLQVRDVQTWINALAKQCQCCVQGRDARRPEKSRRCCAKGQCCERKLSARTVADVRNCLRSALSCARSEELISRNVAAMVKLPAVRKRRGASWSSDEARRFLESARAGADPLYAAFVLILVLGLRRGEVLGLTWSDVDLDQAELVVGHQLQRVRRKLLHRDTKTEASDATLPLPDICTAALRLHRDRQDATRRSAGEAWLDSDLVFTTRYGRPVEPRNFNRSFHGRCARAEVRRIKVHDARRTCASLLADLDIHPRVVMQILRHAQFAVTMEIYTQVSSKATREALRRLGEELDSA